MNVGKRAVVLVLLALAASGLGCWRSSPTTEPSYPSAASASPGAGAGALYDQLGQRKAWVHGNNELLHTARSEREYAINQVNLFNAHANWPARDSWHARVHALSKKIAELVELNARHEAEISRLEREIAR
jgi:hypothetical protein